MQISEFGQVTSNATAWSSFEEERQEALESVLEAMAAESGDAACAAACACLLGHLRRGPGFGQPSVRVC